MGRMSSRRQAARVGLAAAACATAFAGAGQAYAATTAYPAGGSTFDGDEQGWVGSATTCTLPLALVCEATNTHDAAEGNPPGSIATNVNVVLGLGTVDLLTGGGTWTSPPFTVPAGDAITGADFSYDRRFDAGGLLNLSPTSTVSVTLIDETTGTSAPVLTDPLTEANAEFAAAQAPAAVVGGHTYRLALTTTTAATLSLSVLSASSQTRFDNVALTVETAAAGSGNSPGVTVVRDTYGDSEIDTIIDSYGNVDVEAGPGRDGSLIPLALCTIVGTSGPDRITGTSGNDVICGLGGNDVITGVGGRDAIDAASGDDRAAGGLGADLLLGLAGNDRLDGGADADRIGGGAGRDRIESGNGNDLASGASGNDAVGGEAGHDVLRGLAGNDRINGGPGRDRLNGGRGRDVLRGFSGFDRLMGGPGRDRLLVRDGRRDVAHGGSGRDRGLADASDRVRGVQSLVRR